MVLPSVPAARGAGLNRLSRRFGLVHTLSGSQKPATPVDSAVFPPIAPPPNRSRARRIGVVLGVVIVGLVAAGGYLFMRSEARWAADPGHSSRDPQVLDQMLVRGEAAERAGDRGSAIAAYRFVLAVRSNGDPTMELYMAAARRGLARLGVEPPK